ncbi:ribonuclease H-like domain-containing protein [Mycena metata]|uniref:3'-5' exonuclease n=1 Tax=Mycena metata TaxID=1033252 RepID=A0AAD7ICF4_9AGAR|nr:ribonuclease H-like domain-containing protein [Mycena metata]
MSAVARFVKKTTSAFKSNAGRTVGNPNVDQGQDDKAHGDELKPFPADYRVTMLSTEHQVDTALRSILDGVIGFDTEFTERTPTKEEQIIVDYYPHALGIRKQAMTGMQIAQLHSKVKFDVAWDNVGIRLVQIAWEDEAWVIDLRAMKGDNTRPAVIPKELARVLQSPDISKAGVGLIKDISVVWDDLRMEMKNLVDVGMMAKLVLAERYPKVGYGNMSLKQSVADILGFRIDKDLQTSDWAAVKLTDDQIQCEPAAIKHAATNDATDAALDAMASLRLHKSLVEELKKKSAEVESPIPKAWYSFNTKAGEPTRIKRGADNTEIAWKTSDYVEVDKDSTTDCAGNHKTIRQSKDTEKRQKEIKITLQAEMRREDLPHEPLVRSEQRFLRHCVSRLMSSLASYQGTFIAAARNAKSALGNIVADCEAYEAIIER